MPHGGDVELRSKRIAGGERWRGLCEHCGDQLLRGRQCALRLNVAHCAQAHCRAEYGNAECMGRYRLCLQASHAERTPHAALRDTEMTERRTRADRIDIVLN